MSKSNDLKNKVVQVRMTYPQWKALRVVAKSFGMGLSTMMLHEALEAVARRKVNGHG